MPRPTSSTTIQRPDLGQLAYEYALAASQRGFIGQRILPIFPVTEQSADYPVIPKEALLKLPDTNRGPKGNYNRGDYQFETGTYACEEHGWEQPLDDVEAKLYQRFFDGEEVAVNRAMDILLRSQEKRAADMLFNASNFSVANVTTEWSTAATCTPKSDVTTGAETVRKATGLTPNALVLGKTAFNNLLVCAEIKDYLQYTNPMLIEGLEAQKRILAQYFGVGEILVGDAIYDSTGKGTATTSADIWDDEYALLAVIARNPLSLREPCLGRTFLWTEDSPENLVVEEYREEPIRSNIYRVRHHVDECFVFAGAGYLLGNITA